MQKSPKKKRRRKKTVKYKRKKRQRRNVAIEILIQSLPILLITSIGEVVAGVVLGKMSVALAVIPGLIVLIPAIMDLRGNIGTALGSRVSTMLHLAMGMPIIPVCQPLLIWEKLMILL